MLLMNIFMKNKYYLSKFIKLICGKFEKLFNTPNSKNIIFQKILLKINII